MPDIRQTTQILDDFDRTAENPLSQGGNWTKPGVATNPLQTNGDDAENVGSGVSSHSLYQPIVMSGDECEVWCTRTGGNSPSLAWGIGFYDGTGANANGWLFRTETDTIGGRFRIYKLTNGTFTSVAQTTPGISSPGPMLIRRVGDDIEGWVDDGGDYGSMQFAISYTDSAYQTDMYPVLEALGNVNPIHGWDDFGAGGSRQTTPLPQIIRRTHRRGGIWLP